MLSFMLRNQFTLQHRVVVQYLLIKDLKRLLKTETDVVVLIPSLFSSFSIWEETEWP